MRIAVVDDIAKDRSRLLEGIDQYLGKKGILGDITAYEDGSSLFDGPGADRFDIIFLDIYMDGMDGMEVARRIRKADGNSPSLIVFTTTSAEHAVESFRVRAFDYLLKPYDANQLEEVLDLCFEALGRRLKYIEVVARRNKTKIRLADIIYSDVDGHYIGIRTKTEVIRTRMPFEQFAPLLLADKRFLNCYRNCIINMDEVGSMEEFDFRMKNGERIPITKGRAGAVKQQYAGYVFDMLQHNT